MQKELILAHHLTFSELYTLKGLQTVDNAFRQFLFDADAILAQRYETARQQGIADSDLLMMCASYVEVFLADLFNIMPDILTLQRQQHDLAPLFTIKRLFVQRIALKKYPEAKDFDGAALAKQLGQHIKPWTEFDFAKAVTTWLQDESTYGDVLDLAARYAAWACYHISDSILFHVPKRLDPQALIDFEKIQQRPRHGFRLTDPGFSREQALDQANYCIWCHHQGKDSCSKGLKSKIDDGESFQKNAFGKDLKGCPLEQKISEMNEIKAKGFCLGALAIIMVDNPLVAATGHRICNDCMKACIFQKQEPVNIPGVETQILKEILQLPWGVEIYILLTRWNPLNMKAPLPQESSGYKVLVAGMGPSGFTLAHYLLNQGHTVVGVDGLKIEPLPAVLKEKPIYSFKELWEPLDQRINWGFGGVAEYGITVRWDKNFLKLIRLILERRETFSLFGGVRLGGTLTTAQAFQLGFDHVALCLGAGKPNLIPLKNNLAKGVRQASDFLMALQLTGAAKANSIANLQIRLPIIVIGGGLTAVDTATEALAYYPVQVEKFLQHYEVVGDVWQTEEDREIAEEFLAHARELRTVLPGRHQELLRAWGGATLVYRRDFQASPSYTLNHEEVAKALEEGIQILEKSVPREITVDAWGAAKSLIFQDGNTISARTILMATGTVPNTNLQLDEPVAFESHPTSVLMENGHMSYWGDLHPSYAGNVVKAMASAKHGAPMVDKALRRKAPQVMPNFLDKLHAGFDTHVVRVERLTPTIIEIIIHAPFAAAAFRPGQFYRLQNYETLSSVAMEGIALTGAGVSGEEISLIVLEMGGSSNLCAQLRPGEPVVLMGPTGTPTEIPENETVLLIGGGLGNAVLFSIGRALKDKGNRILYFAGYRKCEDRYKASDIEAAADQIVWCCEESPGFQPTRSQDLSFQGNMLAALHAYAHKQIKGEIFDFKEFDRLLVIGSDRLMGAVSEACHGDLKAYFRSDLKALASINSPMQCMMKGICAQCLQRHRDPVTGEETIVYSCINQDQDLTMVDFSCLQDRLNQNHAQEVLTNQWIAKLS